MELHRPLSFTSLGGYKKLAERRRGRQFKASWEDLAGVLVFSAIPFTAVKAIANSWVGESLRKQLAARKKAELLESSRRNQLSQQARRDSIWYGEGRPRWLGPITFDYPAYLCGEFPGDYGFDIAGLAKDPAAFGKLFNFEVLHARGAMLAALGALIPEVLELSGTCVVASWLFQAQGRNAGLHLSNCQALLMARGGGPKYGNGLYSFLG